MSPKKAVARAVGVACLNLGVSVHDLLPKLPPPSVLQRRARAFAVLDAIFEPRFRRHWYLPKWSANGAALGSMDNGSGDNYSIVFDSAGTLLLGFDHESAATPWRDDEGSHWPGLLDGVPAVLQPYLEEPAFQFDGFLDITVCAWHEPAEGFWRCGPVDFDPDLLLFAEHEPDGAEDLFGLLADGTAEAYARFAADYFSVPVDAEAVAAVMADQPLIPQLAATINPDIDYAHVHADVAAMGYPTQAPQASDDEVRSQ